MHGGGTLRVVREGVLLPIHDPHMAMQPGDIISIDGGLDYLGYETDIKRAAYILRPGEKAVPDDLMIAWKAAHAMGALYAKNMVVGHVGHDIWATINKEAQAQGYEAVGTTSCTQTLRTCGDELGKEDKKLWERLIILDSIEFLHDYILPQLEIRPIDEEVICIQIVLPENLVWMLRCYRLQINAHTCPRFA